MKIRKLALCGLFAALLCISAWLAIPFGQLAFTMQTFAVSLCLYLLGGKLGCAAIFAYLLLGGIGLPVFSGFRGGLGVLLGATGGYIFGFLGFGLVYWLITAFFPKRQGVAMAAGLLVCYGCGTAWYSLMYLQGAGVGAILLQSVLPYLAPDILKIVAALAVGKRLKRVV